MIRFLLILFTLTAWAGAKPPNVILIITDDQGYGDLGAHGNPVLKTPNMDKLHAESVRFTDFHVAPMCSPTRGQLMTGRDAMKNGCTAVCQGRSMMRADIPTMANFFADSGYATGHFGKWHLGDSYPHRPQDRGFQETIHHRAWGITSLADYWGNSYFDPVLSHNGVDRKFEGYCTDIFFDETLKWIEKQAADDKPFFAYLPTNTPHVPNVVAEEFSKPYQGSHDGKPIPDTFYGMIANIDANLGKLETFLKDKGLRENTLLIYMSDNGTQSSGAAKLYNAGMRDKKTSVFEGGHRVPLFVRWPAGKLQHGNDVDTLTQVQDLLPTLIDLCGLKSERPRQFDGTSLFGPLTGSRIKFPDRKLVVQYRTSGEPWNPAVVMWNKWRMVGPDKLYHVGKDPHQDVNVAATHPEVVKAMVGHYQAWHAEAKPLFDTPRWITIGKTDQPLIMYSQDWVGDYCDNPGGLFAGRAVGYWNVIVDRPGTYKIELRRWPFEAEIPLSAPARNRGARPIVAANLQIAGGNYTVDTKAEDKQAAFLVKLPAGKQQLATHFLDDQDRILCSAIYTRVTRVDAAELTPPSKRKPTGRAVGTPRKGPKRPKGPKQAAAFTLGPDDILIADFEGKDWGDWKSTGTAFGSGPTGPKGRVAGFQGQSLADTFLISEGDAPTGTLSSPPFSIKRKFINLLVGGGKHSGETCVNLIVDGEIAHSATGSATKNAENKKIMHWISWEVAPLKGKTATVQLVDRASGGWGHIMADHIYQSNRAAPQ